MPSKKDNFLNLPLLRQKAENNLRYVKEDKLKREFSESDITKLYHELRVYTEELKLQNEELSFTRQKLEEALDKYVMLYDFSPSGYLTLNPEGTIIEVNLTFAKMCNTDRSRLVNEKLNLRNLIPENSYSQFNNFLFDIFHKNSVIRCQIELIPDSKKQLFVNIEGKKSLNGKSCFITITDISDLMHAEISQRKTLNDLIISNNELEKFVNIITHQMQEPLAKIIGYSQMLEKKIKDKLNSEGDYIITELVNGAMQVKSIAGGLIRYSRIDNYAITGMKVDCNSIIQQVLFNLHYLIEDNNAEINYPKLPVVKGNFVLMTQLFQNIIENSIKFCGNKKPVINISTAEDNTSRIFKIEDNGIGIAPQFHEKIFRLFEKLDDQNNNKGSGVGLAIAKKIVEKHNGNIWVKSEPGKGSTFYVLLPK